MSTVQSLLDNLQFRVDVDADLYHIINLAIRTIGKHLYALESDILRSPMEIKAYASVDYTASLALVGTSSPYTITDAANQFVAEGFVAGMHITTTSTTSPGPFGLATVAVGTLTLDSTDSLTAAGAASLTITSDASCFNLPTDFWGLCDKPYIDGKTYPLRPLPNMETVLLHTTAGEPLYYKIKGTHIYLTPATATDYTIKADDPGHAYIRFILPHGWGSVQP